MNKLILFCIVFLCPSVGICAPRTLSKKPLMRPLVLVHGATQQGSKLKISFLDFGDYFRGIKEFYESTGTKVYVPNLPTDGTIGERAAVLKNFLETDLRGTMVNVVGHSLGGLDARYAASVLGSRQIATITTIGTPHRGSPLANWAVRQMDGNRPWYWFFRFFGFDMRKRRFLREITPHFMEQVFNPKVQNLPDVQYYSVATFASFSTQSMSYLLWFTNRWLERERHPLTAQGHDGLVPLDSQIWGTEIYRAQLDHLGQINHHEMRNLSFEDVSYQAYTQIYENLSVRGH